MQWPGVCNFSLVHWSHKILTHQVPECFIKSMKYIHNTYNIATVLQFSWLCRQGGYFLSSAHSYFLHSLSHSPFISSYHLTLITSVVDTLLKYNWRIITELSLNWNIICFLSGSLFKIETCSQWKAVSCFCGGSNTRQWELRKVV